MSDSQCVGVCMIDWDAGVCIGCGRSTAEIEGEASAAPATAAATDLQAVPAAQIPPAEEGCSDGV